jgi:transposase-like protein
VFVEKYGVKYARATECLTKDKEALLAFYDMPAAACARVAAPEISRRSAVIADWSDLGTLLRTLAVLCECLTKDKEALLAFYDMPAEHWDHLRTTNPIESVFALSATGSRPSAAAKSLPRPSRA